LYRYIKIRETFAKFAEFFRELHDSAKKLGDVNGKKCAPAVLFQVRVAAMFHVANLTPGSDNQKHQLMTACTFVPCNQVPCNQSSDTPRGVTTLYFQELLHRMAGVNAGVSMDEQKRDGDVPMHQAKVLDRRHRTADECADMDAVIGAESVMWLVGCVKEMRLILRGGPVQVESS
jgi:hypothetical protein